MSMWAVRFFAQKIQLPIRKSAAEVRPSSEGGIAGYDSKARGKFRRGRAWCSSYADPERLGSLAHVRRLDPQHPSVRPEPTEKGCTEEVMLTWIWMPQRSPAARIVPPGTAKVQPLWVQPVE